MTKTKKYRNVFFTEDVIRLASDSLRDCISDESDPMVDFEISRGNETWNYDSEDEFFVDYRVSPPDAAWFRQNYNKIGLRLVYLATDRSSTVHIKSTDRRSIEIMSRIFDDNEAACRLESPEEEDTTDPPVVFIGHGNDGQWRQLKDHLHDSHNFDVEAYEVGARAGHDVRDILESMLNNSSFALLVMTAEDCMEDGSMRPRQNVVHEAGLFQGRLGFGRAIMIVEEGVEDFSNIASIQQIRFSTGNIREVFGDVLATLNREFGS